MQDKEYTPNNGLLLQYMPQKPSQTLTMSPHLEFGNYPNPISFVLQTQYSIFQSVQNWKELLQAENNEGGVIVDESFKCHRMDFGQGLYLQWGQRGLFPCVAVAIFDMKKKLHSSKIFST